MKLQYHIVDENGIAPYISELRSIEKKIEYPLDDGNNDFFIDHGEQYSPFFTQQGHKTRFLIIKNGNEVIGSVAAVWKKIFTKKKFYNCLYASDLKLKLDYRSKGVVKNFLWYLFIRWPFRKEFQGWDFLYFCAMQRKSRGVESTFQGFHLGKLTSSKALLNIYILDPNQLEGLDFKEIAYNPKNEINLSPHLKEDVLWNRGKKNIIFTKDNSLMNLGHLNPELFYINNIERLKKALKVVSRKKGKVCFAIDSQNQTSINGLKNYNILTDTKCKVFSFSPYINPLSSAELLSVSTGEI